MGMKSYRGIFAKNKTKFKSQGIKIDNGEFQKSVNKLANLARQGSSNHCCPVVSAIVDEQ